MTLSVCVQETDPDTLKPQFFSLSLLLDVIFLFKMADTFSF